MLSELMRSFLEDMECKISECDMNDYECNETNAADFFSAYEFFESKSNEWCGKCVLMRLQPQLLHGYLAYEFNNMFISRDDIVSFKNIISSSSSVSIDIVDSEHDIIRFDIIIPNVFYKAR